MRKQALYALGLVVAAIVALGLVVLSSASGDTALRLRHGQFYFMNRQIVFLGAGIAVAVVTALFDYHHWKDHPWLSWAFYAVVVALLLYVLRCPKVNGSHRWISFGPVNLQPSELAKLAVVVVVGVWMDRAAWRVELFAKGAFWPMLVIGGLVAPILCEVDFGAAMVVALAGLLVMFVAGTRLLHALPFALLGLLGVGGLVIFNPNRMARIAAFLGIKLGVGAQVADAAAENAAYQAQQALIAIMNGGIWGVGLNQSMQKHYYLPEAHTDMIFAIGAEELGLAFSVGTILLFVGFLACSVYIARKASDRFGRFLVVGMTFIVFFQAMFNIGVVCEALPMKGMALPFFSYGGTNMLSAFFAVGTIFSVGIHSGGERRRKFANKVLTRGRANG